MNHSLKIALRVLVVLTLVGLLPALFNAGSAGRSPYLSALTQIAGSDAYAQVACNDKGCVSGGHGHSNCGKLRGYYCYKYWGSSCSTGSC